MKISFDAMCSEIHRKTSMTMRSSSRSYLELSYACIVRSDEHNSIQTTDAGEDLYATQTVAKLCIVSLCNIVFFLGYSFTILDFENVQEGVILSAVQLDGNNIMWHCNIVQSH